MFHYFWMEGIDLPEGIGFGLFTAEHLSAVAICSAGITILLRIFLNKDARTQLRWLRTIAVLLLLGNIARDVFLLCKGRMSVAYLPFHLCSFAIFVYLLYAFLPERYCSPEKGTAGSRNRSSDEVFKYYKDAERHSGNPEMPVRRSSEAYSLQESGNNDIRILQSGFRMALGEIGCVLLLPGAVMALIFPDWSNYPLLNFMCIHSFLWHAVLTAYPLMIWTSGRAHPTIRHIWYPVLYLAVLVPPTLWFDRCFGVNYLFINWPLPDTPLMAIYNVMGSWWLAGYAALVAAVLLAEYIVIEIIRRF